MEVLADELANRLLSAAPARHDLSEAERDVFLQKPFRFDTLLEEVNKLLG